MKVNKESRNVDLLLLQSRGYLERDRNSCGRRLFKVKVVKKELKIVYTWDFFGKVMILSPRWQWGDFCGRLIVQGEFYLKGN